MRSAIETRVAAWQCLRRNGAYGTYLKGMLFLFFLGFVGFWALEWTVSICGLYLSPVIDSAALGAFPEDVRGQLEQLRQVHVAFKQSPAMEVGMLALGGALVFSYVAGFLGWSGRSMAIANARGGLTSMHVFSGWGNGWKMARLLVLRGFLVTLGLVALVIPGFYLRSVYSVAPYLLIDHPDWSAWECMRESARLTAGRRLGWLELDIGFTGWNVAAMVLFVVLSVMAMATGSLVVFILGLAGYWLRAPYQATAFALFYEELLDQSGNPLGASDEINHNENERQQSNDEH